MSYDGGVLVTFSAISDGQADVNTTVAAIDQEMSDLRSFVANIYSTWGGAAAQQYQALQQQWDTAAADLNAVLQRIGQALGTAHDNYVQTETANSNVWS